MTYVESLRDGLHQAMERDPNVVMLGEDILDPYGGAFKVTRGLSTAFPERVFTTPICEASITGMAVGLALRGMRPVAELMFGDFITLGADQIVNHAAKFPAMYNGKVQVPLVIRTPMGGGRGYGPTHSQTMERLFLGIPHLRIVAPSHYHNPGAMLQAAIADFDPVIFIENKLLYPEALLQDTDNLLRREVIGGGYPDVIVRNYTPGEQPDVTLVAYGGMSNIIDRALRNLAEEEIRVVACFPGSISPLPMENIIACARETGRVLVAEESNIEFGWGAEVAAGLYEALHGTLHAPIRRVGAASAVIPAAKHLEDAALPGVGDIEQAILGLLN